MRKRRCRVRQWLRLDAWDDTGSVLFPSLLLDGIRISDLLRTKVNGSDSNYGYLNPMIRTAFLCKRGIRYDQALRVGEGMVLYHGIVLSGAVLRTVEGTLYICLTRRGTLSGAFSEQSLTVPNDKMVVTAFERLLARRSIEAGHPDRPAIETRFDHLHRIRLVARFYLARRMRDLLSMLWSAAEPAVRSEPFEKVGGLLGQSVKH